MSTSEVRRLAGRLRDDGRLRLRQGVVDSVNTDGTIDVTVGGDDIVIDNVALVGGRADPTSGVWLLQAGTDLVALGSLGGPFLARDHFVNSDPLTSYPYGITVMDVTTSGAGWPEQFGLVETMRMGDDYNRQTFTSMNTSPPNFHVRRWVISSSSWSSWATL